MPKPTLQSVFDHTQKTKAEIKTIKAMIRQALQNSNLYQSHLQEYEDAKSQLKTNREAILSSCQPELDKLSTLQADLKNDMTLMSDIAMNMMVKGESIEVFDKKQNKFQPCLSLHFKKK